MGGLRLPLTKLPSHIVDFIGKISHKADTSGDMEQFVIPTISDATNELGQRFKVDSTRLYYPKNPDVCMSTVTTLLSRQFEKKNILVAENTAYWLLSIGSQIAWGGKEPHLWLLDRLNGAQDYKVFQFLVLPNCHPLLQYDGTIGSYRLGKVSLTKIRNLCDQVHADYYQRYKGLLKDQFCISRENSVKVVPLNGCEPPSSSFTDLYWAVWGYFEELARTLLTRFWADLRPNQRYARVFNTAWDEFALEFAAEKNAVTIFKGKNYAGEYTGWVSPCASRPGIQVGKDHGQLVSGLELWVRDSLRQNTSLYNANDVLDRYTLFLARGLDHEKRARLDEALLHYVMCFEILFGDSSTNLSEQVSRRGAVVCHKYIQSSVPEARKKLKTVYDVRSKYVHQGTMVERQDVREVRILAYAAYFAILNLACAGQSFDTNRRNEWLKKLDFVSAKVDCGHQIDQSDLTDVGFSENPMLERFARTFLSDELYALCPRSPCL